MANNFSFTTAGATPHLPQGSTPESQGGTPAARALNSAQGIAPPPIPLIPPMNTDNPAIKSHSIQHPDGTIITQQFHKPEEGLLSGKKPAAKPATAPAALPPMKIVNGMHHIPFKSADGSIKFINAKGEIS